MFHTRIFYARVGCVTRLLHTGDRIHHVPDKIIHSRDKIQYVLQKNSAYKKQDSSWSTQKFYVQEIRYAMFHTRILPTWISCITNKKSTYEIQVHNGPHKNYTNKVLHISCYM